MVSKMAPFQEPGHNFLHNSTQFNPVVTHNGSKHAEWCKEVPFVSEKIKILYLTDSFRKIQKNTMAPMGKIKNSL